MIATVTVYPLSRNRKLPVISCAFLRSSLQSHNQASYHHAEQQELVDACQPRLSKQVRFLVVSRAQTHLTRSDAAQAGQPAATLHSVRARCLATATSYRTDKVPSIKKYIFMRRRWAAYLDCSTSSTALIFPRRRLGVNETGRFRSRNHQLERLLERGVRYTRHAPLIRNMCDLSSA